MFSAIFDNLTTEVNLYENCLMEKKTWQHVKLTPSARSLIIPVQVPLGNSDPYLSASVMVML